MSLIAWPVRLTAAANYEVAVNYDAEDGSEGGTFEVTRLVSRH